MKTFAIPYSNNGKQRTAYIDADSADEAEEGIRSAYFQRSEPKEVVKRFGVYW